MCLFGGDLASLQCQCLGVHMSSGGWDTAENYITLEYYGYDIEVTFLEILSDAPNKFVRSIILRKENVDALLIEWPSPYTNHYSPPLLYRGSINRFSPPLLYRGSINHYSPPLLYRGSINHYSSPLLYRGSINHFVGCAGVQDNGACALQCVIFFQ